jgi:predicted ArsR family transcriptional regulator
MGVPSMTAPRMQGQQVPADPVATLLESPVRREIVDRLANLPTTVDQEGWLPGLTAAELAEQLGLHVTTVRFHLDQLVAGRLLDSEFRAGRVGRPRKVYRFKPGSLTPASTGAAYQALAELLAESWDVTENGVPLTPEQAGQKWAVTHAEAAGDVAPATSAGAWLGKVGRTVDMLGRWGYTPELRTTDEGRTAELTLVDCPFLALAQSKPELVCGVHRGLLRGAMDAVGESDTEVTLRPFVGPGRCLATITTRAEFGGTTRHQAGDGGTKTLRQARRDDEENP